MNLNQITIPSKDLLVSVAFYKKLGLKLIVDSIPRYARFVCPNGNATFSVEVADELPKGKGIKVYFECEDLYERVEELQKKGVEFDQLPELKEWMWEEAYLKDPDKNQVVLYRAGRDRIDPPWRIEEE